MIHETVIANKETGKSTRPTFTLCKKIQNATKKVA